MNMLHPTGSQSRHMSLDLGRTPALPCLHSRGQHVHLCPPVGRASTPPCVFGLGVGSHVAHSLTTLAPARWRRQSTFMSAVDDIALYQYGVAIPFHRDSTCQGGASAYCATKQKGIGQLKTRIEIWIWPPISVRTCFLQISQILVILVKIRYKFKFQIRQV
jgi:hypothetical protein